jgi:hypothetical protein
MLARAVRALEDVGLLIRVDRPDLAGAIAEDRTVRIGPPPAPKTLQGQLGTPQHPGPRAPDVPAPLPPDTPVQRPVSDTNDSRANDAAPKAEEAKPTTPARDEAAAEGQTASQAKGAQGAVPATQGGRTVSGQWPAGGRTAAGQPPSDVSRETGDPRPETGDGQTPTVASAAPSPPSAHGNGETPNKRAASASPPPADGETADATRETGEGRRALPQRPPRADSHAGDEPPGEREVTDACPATAARDQPTAVAEPGEPTKADPGGANNSTAKGKPDAAFAPTSAYLDAVDMIVKHLGQALYPTREDMAIEGRKARPMQGPDEFEARERGCLLAAWSAVMELGIGPVELYRLEERAIKEAVATRRKRLRKPRGAWWRCWFNKHMQAHYGAQRWAQATRKVRAGIALGPPPGG